MITVDFHTHSNFSGDSDALPEEHIKKAVALGLTHLCFTDHMDFDYPYLPCEGERSLTFNSGDYFSKLKLLKEAYRSQINIGIGMELGLRTEDSILPLMADRINQAALKENYDFIIGSCHLVDFHDPYFDDFWAEKTDYEALKLYFEAILKSTDIYTCFDVYGHFDYPIRYSKQKKDFRYEDFAEYIEPALKNLVRLGKGIELNTGGLYRGLSDFSLMPDILRTYKGLGGEIVTVGSDAHDSLHLAYGREKANELLQALGFKYYTIFEKRKPLFIQL